MFVSEDKKGTRCCEGAVGAEEGASQAKDTTLYV